MKLIHFSFLLGFCSLLCLSGCGKPANPDGRLDVSGTITFNGGPFEGANATTMIFEPIDDKSSGASTVTFNPTTGKYLCTMQNGLKPGKYRVKIEAHAQYDRKTGQPVGPDFGSDFKEGEPESSRSYFVSLVPPEFNKESTIEFEVVAGKKNVFDYNIETSYVPNTTPP